MTNEELIVEARNAFEFVRMTTAASGADLSIVLRLADALEAALPVTVEAGVYRNSQGAELHLIRPQYRAGAYRLLHSDIWEAEARDSLFGTTYYLVTATSLRECGYTRVEAVTS
jgi:hypothetical protein